MKGNAELVKWGMFVLAGVWVFGGEVLHAQEERAVVSMVETALAEFETPNGPIVELESRLRCSEVGHEERGFCPEPFAETALAEYASGVGARLVSEPSGLPACRWNERESDEAKGLQKSLLMHRDAEGTIWISVTVRCERDPGHYMGSRFMQSARYPFRLVDGAWARSGEAITIIT